MITLLKKQELADLNAERLHPHVAKYLKDYFSHMLTEFNCDNIAPYGGIMLLESADDVRLFDSMGIRSEMQFDIAVQMVLGGETDIMQMIYKYYNKAIVVFASPDIANPIIAKEYDLHESKEEKI